MTVGSLSNPNAEHTNHNFQPAVIYPDFHSRTLSGLGILHDLHHVGLSHHPASSLDGNRHRRNSRNLGLNLGGLLNATFGNATELIIGIVALNAGLINVVKASITGSIIGNLLQ